MMLTEHIISRKIDITSVDLSNLSYNSIELGAFDKYLHLERIDLSNNYLTTIGSEFDKLKNLNYLNLSNNRISSISDRAFENLSNLGVIDLRNNQLNQISENLFIGLVNLKAIYLENDANEIRLALEDEVELIVPIRKLIRIKAFDYTIDRQNPGLALLINNNKFHGVVEERTGSTKDLEDLEVIFKDMNFKVTKEENKSADQIKELLSEYAKTDHSNGSGCFICVVMSHGNENGVEGVDREVVDLKKEILNTFNDCWIGKPKLFFINACNGGNIMGESYTAEGDQVPETRLDSIPTHSDILISYSTVEGFVSIRDPNDGSIYIQSLVKMIRKYKSTKHLTDILTRVNFDVARYTDDHGSKQMPNIIVNTLRKRVFLR